MSQILTNNKNYYDIADTIRQMKNVNTTYKPREMAPALKDIYSNEAEGTLPLSFESNGMPLIDYRIDGANGGVGDKTNNLFDLKKAVKKKYINSNGNEATSLSPAPENTLNHSDYVSIDSNVNYTFTCNTSQNYSLANTIALCWFDENKNILSRNTMDVRGNISNYSITALSPSTAKYLIVNFIAYVDDAVFYLNEGTTTVFEHYGYKVPVVVSGKNLLKINATSQTINGVTFTVNEDGSVTCNTDENGATTDTRFYLLGIGGTDFKRIECDTAIKLTGCPSGGSSSTYYISLLRQNDSTYPSYNSYADFGNGFVPSYDATNKYVIYIQIKSGQVCTNLTFYPMIRKADIEDGTYEPYHEPTTTNIYLDEPIEENESISLSDTEVDIPTIDGTNTLTIDTTVQPSNVYVQAPKDNEEIVFLTQVLEEGI